MKNTSVVIRPQTQFKTTTYQVEFYGACGRRKRKSFKNKTDAELFKKSIVTQNQKILATDILRAQGIVLDSDSLGFDRKSIQEAMYEMYEQRMSAAFNKDSVKLEKFNYNLFGKFIFEEMMRDYCDEITLLDLEKFRQKLKDKSLANSSIERRFTFVRAFLNYCVAHKYRKDNPAQHIKKLHIVTVKPELWTEQESINLFNALPEWAQDFTAVLIDTMARPIEIARLKLSDINFFSKSVTLISGKGASVHQRTVPLTVRACEVLQNNISRQKKIKPWDFVFKNSKGTRVTTNVYDKAVRIARRELKLSENLKPYGFRHGGLTALSNMNINQKLISDIAGHRKAQTTQRYMHTNDNEMRNVINLTEAIRKKAH